MPWAKAGASRRLVEEDLLAKETVETAIALERTVLHENDRHNGIIISDSPLAVLCPVNSKEIGAADKVCNLDGYEVQELGLMGIDCWSTDKFVEDTLGVFLETSGLATLNRHWPDDDPRAFEILAQDDDRFYCEAHPTVFKENLTDKLAAFLRERYAEEYGQLGHLLAKVQPRSIEELIALYAMYRPGPMQFLNEYLRRRSGEVPVAYETPELEAILKETYGLILYQEQFMQVVHVISGLSLGKADRMRRHLGKVQQTEMWHDIFFKEAGKRGFNDDCIARIWEKLIRHAPFIYLKAHAAARALLLYRVACIKGNAHGQYHGGLGGGIV